jgi:hypothetical protein
MVLPPGLLSIRRIIHLIPRRLKIGIRRRSRNRQRKIEDCLDDFRAAGWFAAILDSRTVQR